jgi:hypothetical protein
MKTISCDYQESVMIYAWLFPVYDRLAGPTEVIFALMRNSFVTNVTNLPKKK